MECPKFATTINWRPNLVTGEDLIMDTGANGVPNFVHGMCVLGQIDIPANATPGYHSTIMMCEHNSKARYRWCKFGSVPCDLRAPLKSSMQPSFHLKIRSAPDEVVKVGDSTILVNAGATYYMTLTSDDPNQKYTEPGDPRNMRFETRPFTP